MVSRPRTLLVPTDFSDGAALALGRATRLPLGPDAKLVLLHVLPANLPAGQLLEIQEAARATLAKLAATMAPPPDVELVLEVASGEPHAQIIAHARAVDADLVVLGRHGSRRLRDLLIGSTAERTIRYGDVPVLVVNHEAQGPYHRPLIATDLSDASKRVAELAISVLEPHTEIDVVHALRIPFQDLQYFARSAHAEHELEAAARSKLEHFMATLEDLHPQWNPMLRHGDARSVIMTEIAAHATDLAVLGTHGRAGLSRVLVGSVAEFVIAAARCDVLVTRPARFTFENP